VCRGLGAGPKVGHVAEIDMVIADLADETDKLCSSINRLDDHNAQAQASRLPGWSRAHVVVHLARNADGLRSLLLSARTETPLRMYASPRTRSADIDTGVTRGADVIVADALESATRFLVEASAMPTEAWRANVAFNSGQPNAPVVIAPRLLELRLAEVVIHHVDLDVDYGFADVPERLLLWFLEQFVAHRERQGVSLTIQVDGSKQLATAGNGDGPVVEGELAALVAWLAGRSQLGLRCDQALPELPSFG
jgi:maleylpyruvate isomerase